MNVGGGGAENEETEFAVTTENLNSVKSQFK